VEEQGLRAAAYDPAFILPFALHGISEGCINTEEFVHLGLLAVALVSISSSDDVLRKLGYEVLAGYLAALEVQKLLSIIWLIPFANHQSKFVLS
jgi:nucleolar pre-ribosomal-associated protein 1